MLKEDSPNAPPDPALPFTVGTGDAVVHKPQSYGMTAAVCIGGFLVPGLGHLILQRWVRGVLLFGSVVLMFVLGLSMHGALSSLPDTGSLVSFKTLNAVSSGCEHRIFRRCSDFADCGLRLAVPGRCGPPELPGHPRCVRYRKSQKAVNALALCGVDCLRSSREHRPCGHHKEHTTRPISIRCICVRGFSCRSARYWMDNVSIPILRRLLCQRAEERSF